MLCRRRIFSLVFAAALAMRCQGEETKKPCVRRSGDFDRHYNDQFTGYEELSENPSCSVPTGPSGTNYLYARGGLGNQMHCMAALQRLDPNWRAFDNTRRGYLSAEFLANRVSPTPENVHETEALAQHSIYPFPVCNGLIENQNPCNCWHVISLEGDACGQEEEMGVAPSETLKARTAASFQAIPIKGEIKVAAKRFVDSVVSIDSKKRRPLIGVHTRTGNLNSIDGVSQGKQKNPRVLLETNSTDRELKVIPNLATTTFNTARLLRSIRHETRELVTKHSILPTILIASDNVRLSHWLSKRLQESTFLSADNHTSASDLAQAMTDALRVTPNLNVVMAHESKNPDFTNLENDMIELLTLSHADTLVKDNTLRESTYSEAAWWFGGAKAKRVHVPYPQRDLLPKCLKENTNYS